MARSDPRRSTLVAIVGISVAVVAAILIIGLNAGSKKVKVGSVSTQFDVGSAQEVADRIKKDSFPLLLQDPARFTRPVWIQHQGDDASTGWLAFDAAVNGCATQYDRTTQRFTDCSGTTYPADGTGLGRYPVHVVNGHLVLDLNPDGDNTTTTTEAKPTTSIARTGG